METNYTNCTIIHKNLNIDVHTAKTHMQMT